MVSCTVPGHAWIVVPNPCWIRIPHLGVRKMQDATFWNMSSGLFSHSKMSSSTRTMTETSLEVTGTPPSPQKTPSDLPSPAEPDHTAPSATSTPIIDQVAATVPTPTPVDSRPQQGLRFRKTRCDEMTLVFANCNGVRGKKAALEHMLGWLEPDIFIAVESKLDPSVNDSERLYRQTSQSPEEIGRETAAEFSLQWRTTSSLNHNRNSTRNVKYAGSKCISRPRRPC